jgi:hypothetical protein
VQAKKREQQLEPTLDGKKRTKKTSFAGGQATNFFLLFFLSPSQPKTSRPCRANSSISG